MTAKEALKIHSRQYGQPLKGVLLEAVADLEEQATEITSLKAELETERMRLATCGVAAIGYFTGCKDEYRSASLEDTLNLYKVNQELREQLAECKKDAEWLNEAFEHITRIRDYQRINDWQMMGISIREADDWLVACKSTILQKEEA